MRFNRTSQTNSGHGLSSATLLGLEAVTIVAGAPAAQAATEATVLRAALHQAEAKTQSAEDLAAARRTLWKAYVSSDAALGALKSAASSVDVPLFVAGTDQLGLGLRATAKVLPKSDPLIANDPRRKALLAAAEEAGDPLNFALVGGGFYPRVGLSASVPIGGAGYVTAGFAANAGLSYSVLAPYHSEPGAALEAIKNLSTDLPLSASAAKRFAEKLPGGEATFTGLGAIVGYTGAGAGYRLLDLGTVASIHASAGVDLAVTKMTQVALKVRALDADHVLVTLSEVGGQQKSVAAGASVGLFDSITNEVPKLGSWVLRDADSISGGELNHELQILNLMDFRASHAEGTADTEIKSFVIDLRLPKAREAFDGFRRLDTKKADQLYAAGPLSGVRRATLTEKAAHSQDSVTLSVGPLDLLSSIASRNERHGTLKSGERTVQYDRADLAHSWSSFLTNWALGEEKVVRELVSVTDSAAPAPESYFHLRSTVTGDGITSANDMKSFLRLGRALSLIDPSEAEAKLKDDAFLKQFGETDRTVDVFISDQGLQNLTKASAKDLMAAHAAAYEEVEAPSDINYLIGGNSAVWKTTPWLNTSHPSYGAVMSLIKADLVKSGGKSDHGDESSYRAITGRNLHKDAAAYRDARRFTELVKHLAAADTPAARAKVFAQEASDGLDFSRDLVALSRLAGPKTVMIHEMSLKEVEGGGSLRWGQAPAKADPQTTIDEILANPEALHP